MPRNLIIIPLLVVSLAAYLFGSLVGLASYFFWIAPVDSLTFSGFLMGWSIGSVIAVAGNAGLFWTTRQYVNPGEINQPMRVIAWIQVAIFSLFLIHACSLAEEFLDLLRILPIFLVPAGAVCAVSFSLLRKPHAR